VLGEKEEELKLLHTAINAELKIPKQKAKAAAKAKAHMAVSTSLPVYSERLENSHNEI
jgi:hypothetical protein